MTAPASCGALSGFDTCAIEGSRARYCLEATSSEVKSKGLQRVWGSPLPSAKAHRRVSTWRRRGPDFRWAAPGSHHPSSPRRRDTKPLSARPMLRTPYVLVRGSVLRPRRRPTGILCPSPRSTGPPRSPDRRCGCPTRLMRIAKPRLPARLSLVLLGNLSVHLVPKTCAGISICPGNLARIVVVVTRCELSLQGTPQLLRKGPRLGKSPVPGIGAVRGT